MYKKKNQMPMIVTIAAVIILAALLAALSFFRNRKPKEQAPQPIMHQALVYKASGGNIEFDQVYLVSEDDTQVTLSIEEDTMMAFVVKPLAGKVFDSLSINETNNISNEVSYLVNDAEGNDKRINFVMPANDVIINLKFVSEDIREEQTPETETQAETESEVVPASPYDLTLHGLTASILASYDNQFDDVAFLTALGDDLHIASAVSEYKTVTDVTFSEKVYDGEGAGDTDKVFHEIYFNNDPSWNVLSTYYKRDKQYVFTQIEEMSEAQSEETEGSAPGTDATPGTGSSTAGTSSGSGTSQVTGASGGGNYTGGESVEATTSFDIMQVSKTFLKFTGDQDRFYDECFQYVLLKGLTGQIVGTMCGYQIFPEKEKAIFSIQLSSGGTIEGTFNRKKNSYSFSGL